MIATRRVFFSAFRFIFPSQRNGRVTFLSPDKKVTKETGLGEALSVALPRAKAALS